MVRSTLRALCLALLLASAAVAEETECRADRLGTTTCRVPPAFEGDLRPRPRGVVRPDRPALDFVPSTRRDAFGIVRPGRGPLTGGPRLGGMPAPAPPPAICTADSFGNLRCR